MNFERLSLAHLRCADRVGKLTSVLQAGKLSLALMRDGFEDSEMVLVVEHVQDVTRLLHEAEVEFEETKKLCLAALRADENELRRLSGRGDISVAELALLYVKLFGASPLR